LPWFRVLESRNEKNHLWEGACEFPEENTARSRICVSVGVEWSLGGAVETTFPETSSLPREKVYTSAAFLLLFGVINPIGL
jgi:hypothetical protein